MKKRIEVKKRKEVKKVTFLFQQHMYPNPLWALVLLYAMF